MRISDGKQFWAGLLFLTVGAASLWAHPSPIGSLAAMGPGYFPVVLGIGLVGIGAAAMLLGVRAAAANPVGRLPFMPMCLVLGGVVAVGALIARAGLAISLLILVAASCYHRLRSHPFEVAAIYAALLLLIWFIFIDMIQLPIDLLWQS
jgi:hypothetical protein